MQTEHYEVAPVPAEPQDTMLPTPMPTARSIVSSNFMTVPVTMSQGLSQEASLRENCLKATANPL